MTKIGILIAFAPGQPIKNQGIGRLTAFIITAILKDDKTKIVIAVPTWYEAMLLDFLADHHIDINQIELITTDGIPFLFRVQMLIESMFKKLKHRSTKSNSDAISTTTKELSTFSIFYLTVMNKLRWLVALPSTSIQLFKKTLSYSSRYAPSKIKNQFAQIKSHIRCWLVKLFNFRQNILIRHVYSKLRTTELNKLIDKINRETEIRTWFIPTLFWPEIIGIRAKKIVAAPDVVFLDFPLLFTQPTLKRTLEEITQTIQSADHFVCYSEHVKQNTLVQKFSISPEQVSVIKHGNVNLSSLLLPSHANIKQMKQAAHQVLRSYQQTYLSKHPYLKDFDFTDTRYIFYSSQIRPHKNFMSLIQAYEILLKKRFVNIKLITTANLMGEQKIWDYIIKKRLQYDILCFTDVSSETLAALNHLAHCAVNPTLFEGGFPFTFTEAYSVGTPSIMSHIPVVADEIQDPILREKMLFDPYHIDDMVNKIEWAVYHREELLALQAPLYQQMASRSWEVVANDYLNLFKSTDMHQNEICA